MKWFASFVLFIQRQFLRFEPLSKNTPSEFPSELEPIFIIGAPRSGSTLLFQLMVAHYRVAFVSNLMALLPVLLSRLAKITRKQVSDVNDIKESDLGYVPGLHSPNEGGAIMRLWFEEPLPPSKAESVRQTVLRASLAVGGPMVFKNLNNSLRIDNILKVFPKARLVYLQRDPSYNAQSILMARRKLGIAQGEWWSVEPKGFEELLSKDDVEQVAWQVAEINTIVQSALRKHKGYVAHLSYDELTAHPGKSLEELAKGLGLKPKSASPSFDAVKSKNAIRLSENEWDRLQKFFAA